MISRFPICVAAWIGVSLHVAVAVIRSGCCSSSSFTRAKFPCALPTSSSTTAWSLVGSGTVTVEFVAQLDTVYVGKFRLRLHADHPAKCCEASAYLVVPL